MNPDLLRTLSRHQDPLAHEAALAIIEDKQVELTRCQACRKVKKGGVRTVMAKYRLPEEYVKGDVSNNWDVADKERPLRICRGCLSKTQLKGYAWFSNGFYLNSITKEA